MTHAANDFNIHVEASGMIFASCVVNATNQAGFPNLQKAYTRCHSGKYPVMPRANLAKVNDRRTLSAATLLRMVN